MAKMPLDPRLSRMLIEAQTEGCVEEIAVIASALSIQDPRDRPAEKQGEADQAQKVFRDTSSDFITLLNIWNAYHHTWQTVKSAGKMKKYCKTHFLSYRRMREWRDIHSQLAADGFRLTVDGFQLPVAGNRQPETASRKPSAGNRQPEAVSRKPSTVSRKPSTGNRQPETVNRQPETVNRIHKSVLSGFLSNIAVKKEKNILTRQRGRR